jgi:hypothetical protein
MFLLGAGTASASKEAIDYFGTESGSGTRGGEFNLPGGIAISLSGAGATEIGDIYVSDPFNHRIQRFGHENNGTPADRSDDSYPFISAWGADVDSSQSGANYEICTVSLNCQTAAPSGGNGTPSGNGSLASPRNIAIDQDTGLLYVSDGDNRRINVYEGDGTFVRSFGGDVVALGPGDTGNGYEVCIAAAGDTCKAGIAGAGAGQIGTFTLDKGFGIAVSQPDGNPATGTVFLADPGNQRVNTYALDGSSPSSFGSAANFAPNWPRAVTVDSRGIVYASDEVNEQELERYDTTNSNGNGVGFLAPIAAPPLIPYPFSLNATLGLAVDPDSDGAGPDTDVLYVARQPFSNFDTAVQQFGPANQPGLVAPPTAVDDAHGNLAGLGGVGGVAIDTSDGTLYVVAAVAEAAGINAHGVYVLGEGGGGTLTGSLDALSDITQAGVTVHATITPGGPPVASYRLEYSTNGVNWSSTPTTLVGTQTTPQSITVTLSPPGGFEPNTTYHIRLVVSKKFSPTITTPDLTFSTPSAPPIVETVGAPIRTTSTAQLGGTVTPRNSATTYHFEYGDQGPCDANPCTSTPDRSAGAGSFTQRVSEEIIELEPNTTYHYRVVADNGNPGSPASGEDMMVTTRPVEAPLSHGHFPGPPGSDRAWELVSAPEAGGNSTDEPFAISDDGSHAVYGIAGGTPFSDTGGFNQFYAERSANGWKTRKIFPSRDELSGPNWQGPSGPSDLLSFVGLNTNAVGNSFALYRMSADGPSEKLYEVASESQYGFFFAMSDDGSRALMATKESPDPGHPTPLGRNNMYDVTTGSPHLVSLLPGNVVSACGFSQSGTPGPYVMPQGGAARTSHWLSADGNLVFFGDGCDRQLYVRDLDAAETKRLSPPSASGPICGAGFIKSTPEAAFFWSKSRLVSEDTAPTNCEAEADGDVYRYGLDDGSLECVTCVIAGEAADVLVGSSFAMDRIAVADDGSRVYFRAAGRLLPGTSAEGIYRLDVASGDLAYVSTIKDFAADSLGIGSAMTPDGSVMLFSSSDPALNPLGGGPGNAGTKQLYRYDDRDRSLVCVSCPTDGTAPKGNASDPGGGSISANAVLISRDGSIVAFNTPTPLVGADQNTAGVGQTTFAGTDAYEWRGGKHLLLSDGLTNWAGENSTPRVKAMSPSGSDILFTAATQYTADADDDFRRLYDARVGGGFDFPTPPSPCPLEVCQGTPKGAPEEAAPGTRAFSGPGNAAPQRKKQRVRHKKHRTKKHQSKNAKRHAKQRADHDRRASR